MRRVLSLLQAYIGLLELSSARDKYSELCVPMVMVPATVSNNIPGSDLSIGSDTALNAITDVSDAAVTVRRTNAPARLVGGSWATPIGDSKPYVNNQKLNYLLAKNNLPESKYKTIHHLSSSRVKAGIHHWTGCQFRSQLHTVWSCRVGLRRKLELPEREKF